MRRQFAVILIAFFILITLPYVYAYLSASPHYVFGGFLINPLDGNSYLAKMYQGWRGDWRFSLPYSADPGDGAYMFLFYLFLGHLARLTGLSTLWVFHIARLLAAGLMCWVLYLFLRDFIRETTQPWLIFALALMGLGLGYLAFPFGLITSDFWVAETYPYLSAFANPHFPLGLALLLFLIMITHRSINPTRIAQHKGLFRSSIWISVLTILTSLVMSIVTPFGVVIILMILIGWPFAVFARRYFPSDSGDNQTGINEIAFSISALLRQIVLIALGGVPILLYDIIISNMDPVLAGWNAQNLTPSPPLWDLIISLSPALIVAVLGLWRLIHQKPTHQWIIFVWAVLGFVLLFLPIGLQRRFMMGLYVPVVCLAALGLDWMNDQWSTRYAGTLGKMMFLFSLPTVLVLLLVALYGVQKRESLYFLSNGEYQSFTWIELNTPANALIMASPETGMFIPAHTGRSVIYGHPFETVNAQAEQATVLAFFEGSGSDQAAILEDREVDYIFYGPRERMLGTLEVTTQLLPVYNYDDVTIYQVNEGKNSGRLGD